MRRVLCAIALLLSAPVWAGPSKTPAPAGVVTGAPGARAVAQIGNTIYLGGPFTRVGTPTGPFAMSNLAGALKPQNYPLAGMTVNAVVTDGAGGFFVAGTPMTLNGIKEVSVFRVTNDGAFDPSFWPVKVSGEVLALLQVDMARVIIGGTFTAVNNQPRGNLASVTYAGTLENWSPGTNGTVHTIANLTGNKIIVGGSFSLAGGAPRQNLAKLDLQSQSATTWVANVNGPVYAAAFANTLGVWIGGSFGLVNGTARANLALIHSVLDTNNLLPFNLGVSGGPVRGLAVTSSSQVFVAGDFSMAAGQSRSRLAAFDQPSNSLMAWAPTANGTVRTVENQYGSMYIGGDFTLVNGQDRHKAAAVDSTGTLIAWNPAPLGSVRDIAIAAGGVVGFGGNFTGAASVPRPYLAAIDATTGALLPPVTDVDGAVFDLKVHNGHLYLAGLFTHVGGQNRRYAAAIATSGAVQAFNPDPTAAVYRLEFFNGKAYVGGLFQQINTNVNAPYAAVVDPATGGLIKAFPNTDGAVYAWYSDGTRVYAGGAFSTFAGAAEARLVALDSSDTVVPGAPNFAGGSVRAITGTMNGTLFATGDFTSIDGQPRPGLAAFGGVDDGFIPTFNANMNGTGRALAAFGSTVIVGGSLTSFNGTSTGDIAEVSAAGGALASFLPALEGDIYALLVSNNSLWAAGDFSEVDGQPRMGLVRFDNTVPTVSAIADAAVDEDTPFLVPFTIGDGETPAPLLDVSVLSSNQLAIPQGSLSVAGSGATRQVLFTPAENAAGVSAVLTVTVSDGQLSAVRAFTVSINPINDAPSMQAIAPVTVSEDAAASVNIAIGDVDTSAAQLTVSATSSNPLAIPAAGLAISGAGASRTLTLTPAANAAGVSSNITVTVSDGQLTASRTFTASVAGVNDAPTMQPIAAVSIGEDTPGSVSVAIDDIDTPAALLTVSASSDNPTAIPSASLAIAGAGASRTLTFTPAADAADVSAAITVTVSDGQLTASRSFTVSISAVNDPPAIGPIDPVVIGEDNTAFLTVQVLDPDTTALTVAASSSNQALVADAAITVEGAGAMRQLTLRPAANASGTAAVTVTVSDGAASASRTFALTVQPVNDPIAVTPVANVIVAKGQPVPPIHFTVTDVDGDLSSAFARSLDQSLLPDAALQTTGNGAEYAVTITPPAGLTGTVPLEIRAFDAAGIATSAFTLTILDEGEAPEVPVNLRAGIAGNHVTLLWDAVPGGGSPEQYLIEAGVTPGGLELPIQLTHSVERSFSAPVPNGVYFVRIRAVFAGSVGPRSEEIAIAVGTSLVTIPGAPIGLASAVQGQSVTLSWRAPIAGGAASAYVLEAGSAPGLSDIAAAPVGGTVFATTGVPAGRYYVRVRGLNPLGTGPASNEIRLDIGAAACDGQPASPLLLPPTVTGSQVTLSWTPSDAQQYRVLAGTAPGVMNLVNYATGQAASAFVASAPAGTYYVQVIAENPCGASLPSNEVAVVVADPLAAPGSPDGLGATVNGSSVTLTWVPPSGGSLPTGYLIEAGSAPGTTDLARIPTGNATALFGAGGVPAGSYYVRVRAMNAGGLSNVSNEIVVVVP